MDSYVVRIYRREGRKCRVLIGTVEVAGTEKKLSFSNMQELWEILSRRKGRDPFAPPPAGHRAGKEVMSATFALDHEESAEGLRQTNPPQDLERSDSMKRLCAIAAVMLLSSAMFFLVVCAADGPVSKPMTGEWTGTLYNVGVCPFDLSRILTVNIGNGVASGPLGSSNFVFVYCIEPGALTGYGWGIITTAKGDQLHVSISNLNANTAVDPPTWSEEETIVGGTGMFENASGGSFSQGTWTSGAAEFPGTYLGTSYPPPLLLPAQGWVGTSEGEISF